MVAILAACVSADSAKGMRHGMRGATRFDSAFFASVRDESHESSGHIADRAAGSSFDNLETSALACPVGGKKRLRHSISAVKDLYLADRDRPCDTCGDSGIMSHAAVARNKMMPCRAELFLAHGRSKRSENMYRAAGAKDPQQKVMIHPDLPF